MSIESNYYLDFENKFRGDRNKIIQKFNCYDDLIDLILKQNPSANLLDIGCGRGEWLQKCRDKFHNCIGIEFDKNMIKVCIDNGLNVQEGEAVKTLSHFKSGSVSVITIFHMIEHLKHENLVQLINQCQRVLSDDGILIMETPSIDNIIVSTKSFYIDHTHINPINPEAISFHIEKAGFFNVQYFYINGGPLADASHLKITRILNGVAQDLLIIATKTQSQSDLINNDSKWKSCLNIGKNTLEATIDFDLKLESYINNYEDLKKKYKKEFETKVSQYNHEIYLLNQEVILSKEEIRLLKARLKYIIYFSDLLKIVMRPFFVLLKLFRRIILLLCNRIFKELVKHQFIRNILTTKISLLVINFILKRLMNSPTIINASQIKNKVNKITEIDDKLKTFNQNLLAHYEQSPKSKEYKKYLSGRNK